MFLDSKYTIWYYRLMLLGKNKHANEGYHERHHIIPKSLGGLNTDDNIVYLTGRQHFVAHQLLVRMTTGTARQKMYNALWQMKHTRGKRMTSRLYSTLRQEFRASISEQMRGRVISETTRKKMSTAQKGIPMLEDERTKLRQSIAKFKANGGICGGLRSEFHRQRIIETNKKRKGKKNGPMPKGHSAGANNPRAKIWVIETEDGDQFTLKSIKPWCLEHDMVQATLVAKSKKKQFYKGFRIVSVQ